MRENKALLLLAGGMELSWLYAWATFFTVSAPSALSLSGGGRFVCTGGGAHHFLWGRGWRVIFIVFIEAVGFVPLLIRVSVFSFVVAFLLRAGLAHETGITAPGATKIHLLLVLCGHCVSGVAACVWYGDLWIILPSFPASIGVSLLFLFFFSRNFCFWSEEDPTWQNPSPSS